MRQKRKVVRDHRTEAVKNDGWMCWKIADPVFTFGWRRLLFRTKNKTVAIYCARDFRFKVRRFDRAYGTSFFLGIRIGWFVLEAMSWTPMLMMIPTERHKKLIEDMIKLEEIIKKQRPFMLVATPLPEAVQ